MDALRTLILDAPLAVTTIVLSVILFLQAWRNGLRFSSLEQQRDFLVQKKEELETELENLRVEMRGLRVW